MSTMSIALMLVESALLIAQVMVGPPGAVSRGPIPRMMLAGYHVRTSVMGGRFVLVDTLRADVQVVVSPGTDSTEWRYAYSVIHSPNSTGRIDYFAIGPLGSPPIDILSPPHWQPMPFHDSKLVWVPSELGPPRAPST